MPGASFEKPVNGKPLKLWPGEAPGLNPAWKEKGWVPTITPYLCKTRQPRGMVIVFPGGGYVDRAEHERVPIAEFFNRAGFPSAVLDYRVQSQGSPQPLGKGPLWDAQRAIRLVRSYAGAWGVRSDKIAVIGFSAGGHLAAMAGTHFDAGDARSPDPVERVSCRPDAMILCYAVIQGHKVIDDNIFAPRAGEIERDFHKCEKNVTPQCPSAFLWHTATDKTVPVSNSIVMAEALVRCAVSVEMHIFPAGRHGLGLADDEPQTVGQWNPLCTNWLVTQGF